MFRYFLNNNQTKGHQKLIFGIRELNSSEFDKCCLNQSNEFELLINDEMFNFSSNYSLRIYSSGCYYLDQNNLWQSDGLSVNVHFFSYD